MQTFPDIVPYYFKNIFVTVKIGILTLLGQIFLAVGRVKEVTVNLS
jgi:hypothetical protein